MARGPTRSKRAVAREAQQRAESSPFERDYAAICNQYALDVVSGKIPNCKWARHAAQRHLDDLKKQRSADYPYRFDPVAGGKVCAFAEALPHVKGKWAKNRELLYLQPWQVFILCVLFGWLRRSGNRRFRRAYIKIPRKNGKSVLAAVIGLYMLTMDGEHGAEVYSGATTEKQAWEVFRPAKQMFESPEAEDLREYCGADVWAKSLCTADGGRFEPIIGKPGDGSSPHCSITDEYHEHETSDQVDTMETGMGAREQPLLLIITTAGNNLAGPCYDMEQDARKVLEGVVENDEFFTIMFGIDEPEYEGDPGDDWTKPEVLAKANPNINVSVSEDFLRAQQRQAVLNPIHQNRFKTKHLNVWCGAKVAWMPITAWKLCGDPDLKLEEFEGWRCYMVLDLASKDDIAAYVLLFYKDVEVKGKTQRHYWFFARYYIPEAQLDNPDNPNSGKYRKWHKEGYLVATPGDEIDFDTIEADVRDDLGHVQCTEVVYDPWRATQLVQRLRKDGEVTTVEIGQSVKNLSLPMKELLSAVRAGRFHHDASPVSTWMFSNVTAKTDVKDNIYPNKEKNHLKIDGAVAAIMGMNRAMLDPDAGTIDDWLKGGPVIGSATRTAKTGGR